jgi:hypothetical protein
LRAHHHQECILDYISHTVNGCEKAVYIMEALDGVNTDIFVEIKHQVSFPKLGIYNYRRKTRFGIDPASI